MEVYVWLQTLVTVVGLVSLEINVKYVSYFEAFSGGLISLFHRNFG